MHKALKCLKAELQVNASSIETNLGGGNHRYLGLVIIDTECITISNIQPFIVPHYSNQLVILLTATAIETL